MRLEGVGIAMFNENLLIGDGERFLDYYRMRIGIGAMTTKPQHQFCVLPYGCISHTYFSMELWE